MRTLPIFSVILAAVLAASPQLWAQTAPEISLPPGDAVRGKAVFSSSKANCQSCHRIHGKHRNLKEGLGRDAVLDVS
jgi:mono/diheme cytochrome c family protein